MGSIKERQSTDSKQGGEGTKSLHNKGWAPMTKNIGSAGKAPTLPAKTTGTK